MKRAILAFIIVIGLLLIVQISFADEEGSTSASTESAKFEYTLPYPGILPDSPLYFLKVIRDKIEGFLISDPMIKTSFDLQTADKRLASGIALFEKGKKDLAESTISKGENYFEDAIKNINMAQKQGRPLDPSLLTKMSLSSKKHKEVLGGMLTKSAGGLKTKLMKDLQRAESFITYSESLRK